MDYLQALAIVAYWLFGFVLALLMARHMNNGLCALDLLACAVVAGVWPVIAFFAMVYLVATKHPAIYEKKFFVPRK